MHEVDLSQITTLEEYEENQEAVDAFLSRKSTAEEYEANRETIGRLVTLKDYKFIRETLEMTNWYPRDGGGAWAYCSKALWRQWRRDRIQIEKRVLQFDKRNGRYILYTYQDDLVHLLLSD